MFFNWIWDGFDSQYFKRVRIGICLNERVLYLSFLFITLSDNPNDGQKLQSSRVSVESLKLIISNLKV